VVGIAVVVGLVLMGHGPLLLIAVGLAVVFLGVRFVVGR
jgi:hypothetical protein